MSDPYETLRRQMVKKQLAERGIADPRVLEVMQRIPRHRFIDSAYADAAYDDTPLLIPGGQTISQPYIVAFMTEALALCDTERVLEIGTGSGYQTAVLCALAQAVYTVEYLPALAAAAEQTLAALGCANVEILTGDGSQGWPERAPFDAIIVTAAAPAIPGPLRAQLAPAGGRMVIPVGDQQNQSLLRVTRQGDRCTIEKLLPVRFVPLRGSYGFQKPGKNENGSAGV